MLKGRRRAPYSAVWETGLKDLTPGFILAPFKALAWPVLCRALTHSEAAGKQINAGGSHCLLSTNAIMCQNCLSDTELRFNI